MKKVDANWNEEDVRRFVENFPKRTYKELSEMFNMSEKSLYNLSLKYDVHKDRKEQGRKFSELYQSEKKRDRLCLPQKTKLMIPESRMYQCARWRLKNINNYFCKDDRKSKVFYYDEKTIRSKEMESRYRKFTFLPAEGFDECDSRFSESKYRNNRK